MNIQISIIFLLFCRAVALINLKRGNENINIEIYRALPWEMPRLVVTPQNATTTENIQNGTSIKREEMELIWLSEESGKYDPCKRSTFSPAAVSHLVNDSSSWVGYVDIRDFKCNGGILPLFWDYTTYIALNAQQLGTRSCNCKHESKWNFHFL